LIEERDGKKLDATSANPSSSTCAINFTQTNPHTSGALAGGTLMSNPLAQSVNHFHNRTNIEGLAPTFRMTQQTTIIMFRQGYTQNCTSFSMPNFTSASYTPGGTGQAYTHASSTYQAPYTTVAYTDPIPLPGNSLGFLPKHAYKNVSWFNAYGQLEADFGYETPSQFPFRP
jgi:hypothetical protein